MKIRESTPVFLLLSSAFIMGCSSTPKKPCAIAGQPPHEDPNYVFQGKKLCNQKLDELGVWQNDGKYFEWYPNETLATEGFYEKGKKTGRWIEYDDRGKKISDKYFKDGLEQKRP